MTPEGRGHSEGEGREGAESDGGGGVERKEGRKGHPPEMEGGRPWALGGWLATQGRSSVWG